MDIPTMQDLGSIKTLERMADAHEQGDAHVSVGTLREWFGGDEAELTTWLTAQHARGWVTADGRLSATQSITPDGLAEVERVRHRRQDRGLRRRVCRSRVLHWVNSQCSTTNQQVESRRFLLSEHAWLDGKAFEIDELHQAVDYLVDQNLLHGDFRTQSAHLKIGITANGQDCASDFDADVAAYLGSLKVAGPTHIDVSGTGNTVALALGPNSTAAATSVNVEAALQLAAAFREAADILRLDSDDLAALEDVEQTEDISRVRRGLQHLARFASEAASGGVGSVLGAVALKLSGG